MTKSEVSNSNISQNCFLSIFVFNAYDYRKLWNIQNIKGPGEIDEGKFFENFINS